MLHRPSAGFSGAVAALLALLRPVLEPAQLEAFDAERFLQAFQADKKHSLDHYHLIVPISIDPAGLGVQEIELPAAQASSDAVLAAMQQALSTLERELAAAQSVEVTV